MAKATYPVKVYIHVRSFPELSVPQEVIIQAVLRLGRKAALNLISGSYRYPDGSFATKEDADNIYNSIIRIYSEVD